MVKERLLPYVSANTGLALQKELLEKSGNEYVVDTLRRLGEDNPCVANFISLLSQSSNDPVTCGTTGVLVYRLLESQAKADKMEKDLEGKLG